MKKLLAFVLSIAMLISAVAVVSFADDTVTETVDMTKQNYSDKGEVSTATGTNVTITFNIGTGSTKPVYYDNGAAVRLYGGGKMTVSAGGKTISKIVISMAGTRYLGPLSADKGTYEVADTTGTWTGSASQVVFTNTATSGHARIQTVAVTYASEGSGQTDPEEDEVGRILRALYALGNNEALDGTYTLTGTIKSVDTPYNSAYSNVTVTIVCDGYDEYPVQCYRLEGDGADKIGVDDVITVSGKLKNYYNSNKQTNTYEFDAGCHLDSYTLSDHQEEDTSQLTTEEKLQRLYALKDGETRPEKYTLTGVISSVDTAYSTEYQNVTVTMVCDGFDSYPVTCYRLAGEGADKIGVGDTITVTGYFKNHSGTFEFIQGCTLDSYTLSEQSGGDDTFVKPETTEEILKALYALANGKTLEGGSYTLTGTVTKVNTAYSDEYKNVTVTIVCDGFDQYPVQCFRLEGDGADVIGEGYVITVTGTLCDYKGTTKEFAAGCHLDSYTAPESGGETTDPEQDPELEALLKALYALGKNESLEGTHTLTGVVTKVNTPFNSSYNNVTVTIVCGGYKDYPVQCFRLEGDGADIIGVGDTITVTGTLCDYNGNTKEFAAGCHLDSYTHVNNQPDEPTDLTTEEILKLLYALEDGDTTSEKYTLTGKIISVDTAYSDEFKNVTVTIVCGGFDKYPVMCYRLAGSGADTIKVGDVITVTGTFKNYKGTYEFAQGCTLDRVGNVSTGDSLAVYVFAAAAVIALAALVINKKLFAKVM